MNRLTIFGQLVLFVAVGLVAAWCLSHAVQIHRVLLRNGLNFIDLMVVFCVALAFWSSGRGWGWHSTKPSKVDKSRPWEEVHRD